MPDAGVGFLDHALAAPAMLTGEWREQGRADGGEVVGERASPVELNWPLLARLATEPAMQANQRREHLEAGVFQFAFGEKPVVAEQKRALQEID